MSEPQRTWLDLAREVFPDANDDFLDWVLWEKTGFPEFWRTDDPAGECRKQLQDYKAAALYAATGQRATEDGAH